MRRMHPPHESRASVARVLSATALLAMGLAACGDAPTAAAGPQEPGALNFAVIAAASDFVPCGGEVQVTATVTDALGTPVPGVLLNFHVTEGGGSFWAGSGISNSSGVVKDYWTVSDTPNGVNSFETRTVDPVSGDKQVHFAQTVRTATRIVFSSSRDGNWEIYSMLPDGSDLQRLTNHPGTDTEPAWSPDASRIVFTTNRDGNFEIYTMAADGSDLERLTTNPGPDITPAWSPGEVSLIAYASYRDEVYELYLTAADGSGGEQRLTFGNAANVNPDFAPGGGGLVWASLRDGNWEIYHMFLSSPNSQSNLTNNPAEDRYPDWHTGGIVFSSNRDGNREIYLLNGAGFATDLRLTNNPADDRNPAWSRDYTRIVFSRAQGAGSDLYTINPDGTDPDQVTTHLAEDNVPKWSGCSD